MNIRKWFRRKPSSNLVAHAQRELELIGEDPDTIKGYLKVTRPVFEPAELAENPLYESLQEQFLDEHPDGEL